MLQSEVVISGSVPVTKICLGDGWEVLQNIIIILVNIQSTKTACKNRFSLFSVSISLHALFQWPCLLVCLGTE
jgi:hypothetical protein